MKDGKKKGPEMPEIIPVFSKLWGDHLDLRVFFILTLVI